MQSLSIQCNTMFIIIEYQNIIKIKESNPYDINRDWQIMEGFSEECNAFCSVYNYPLSLLYLWIISRRQLTILPHMTTDNAAQITIHTA